MATPARTRTRRRILLAALVLLAIPAIAVAQDRFPSLGGKFRTGREVIVPPSERVSGDLYASGGTVRIEGSVQGDLVAWGGTIDVSGDVGGDVVAAGGTVTVSGRVEGDARAAAGTVGVDGTIGEDLLVASGQLTISAGAEIGEDLIFATGQTTMDGSVGGDVLGSTGGYARRGSVGGSEDVRVSEGAREEPETAADRLLDGVQRLVALLAVGALLLWLVPWSLEPPAVLVRRRFWASLGVGVVAILGLVVAFIAIVLAMILLSLLFGLVGLGDLAGLTVFTGIVALVLLIFLTFLTFAFLAPLVVALAIGRLAFGEAAGSRRWAALVLGVVVLVAVTSIPIIGPWASLAILLLGLGALVLGANAWRRRRRTEALPVPPGAAPPSVQPPVVPPPPSAPPPPAPPAP